jgi:tetratricopeptide (TPR) repeat protein
MRKTSLIAKSLIAFAAFASSTALLQPAANTFAGAPIDATALSCDGLRTVAQASAAVRRERSNAAGYACRARAYAGLRNYRRALADLTRAIRLQPKDAELYIERAQIYLNRDSMRRALADLDRSLSLKPSARGYRARSAAHAELGDFARALADIDAALKLQPASSELYLLRGQLYARYEDFQKSESEAEAPVIDALAAGKDIALAVADFEFVLKLSPDDPSAYLGLAQARRRIAADDVAGSPERYGDALKSVDQALKLKSDYLDAMLLKADILMLSEDYDAAALASDKAIEMAPAVAATYGLRARVRVDLRDFTGALEDANTAIRLDREFAAAYCVRATISAENGARVRAMRDFNTCQRLAVDRETSEWASNELTVLAIPGSLR